MDLDSARAAWLALRPLSAARTVHDTVRVASAPTGELPTSALDAALAQVDTASNAQLATAGDRLERACTAYESACEQAKRAAAAAQPRRRLTRSSVRTR